MNKFVSPVFTISDIDTYIRRKFIYLHLMDFSENIKGTVLDFGAGNMPYKNVINSFERVSRYISLDIHNDYYNNPGIDIFWSPGQKIPMKAKSVDIIICTEVLEHISDPQEILSEFSRILKEKGKVFITVPHIWPIHDSPYDFHRHTPFSLKHLLEKSSFYKLEIYPHGGWNYALAQMLGLWLKRVPRRFFKRIFLFVVLLPLYRILIVRGKKKEIHFDAEENNKITTGYTVIAYK